MQRIASAIAGNPYAQALAIVVAFVTAMLFLWNSRKAFYNIVSLVFRPIARQAWVPREETAKNISLGVIYPSYLVAVVVRHSVVIVICLFFYIITDRITTPLSHDLGKSGILLAAYISLVIVKNVFSLVIGGRAGELMLVTASVKRAIEEAHEK